MKLMCDGKLALCESDAEKVKEWNDGRTFVVPVGDTWIQGCEGVN
jgi:hypothetical protein